MQSSDEVNAKSPTKRLGVALNIDTGFRSEETSLDTPVTLRGRNDGKAALLLRRTSARETFLDDSTPIDRTNNDAKQLVDRDSHDLSLSPRQITRDSLVDNMLLSLDQLSFDQHFDTSLSHEDLELYPNFSEGSHLTDSGRLRGLGHQQSYSSDYDNADDARQPSNQFSHGRRSNSSSNIQYGGGKALHNGAGSRGMSSYGQLRSRGRGSKDSSTNSFDMGYPHLTGAHSWADGFNRRSSSVDRTHGLAIDVGRAQSGRRRDSYEYDAAPTPTVPGGPRRYRPISPQESDALTPTGPRAPERNRSTLSAKVPPRTRPETAVSNAAKYGLHDNSRELPPLPAFNKEPAHTTAKLQETTSRACAQPSTPANHRPGFFRRVFGSSKNSIGNTADASAQAVIPAAETPERSNGKPQHIATQMKTQPLNPSNRQQNTRPKDQPAQLQKKPSSFFRRRKKSVSDQVPMPTSFVPEPPKVHVDEEFYPPKIPHSPVSSLRQIMNPYLESPARRPRSNHMRQQSIADMDETAMRDIDTEDVRGFSPGYEPAKNATIRSVGNVPLDNAEDAFHEGNSDYESPRLRGSPMGPARDGHGATFLQDSSDIDASTLSSSPRLHRKSVQTPPGLQLSTSSSVTRDMAVAADYELSHARILPHEGDQQHSNYHTDDEDFFVVTSSKSLGGHDARIRIQPTASEEVLSKMEELDLPLEGPRADDLDVSLTSPSSSVYKSATSLPLVSPVDNDPALPEHDSQLMSVSEAMQLLNGPVPWSSEAMAPTDSDRQRAQKIYDGNEDFIQIAKAAAWLGEEGPLRARVLWAYMELYDFANIHILAALRILCGRLSLKAESQQVDRILDVFSQRWCICNPKHGLKSTGMTRSFLI
jgi:hypothetical protein